MLVIIAGAGRIGREITRILAEKKHDVVVIDKDQQVCETIYSETGAMTINSSATVLKTLEKAGADKADAIICLMHHEADNIACALLAKSLGVPRIVARLINPIYEQAYKLAGVNFMVRTVDLVINQMLIEIERPQVRQIITLRGGKAQVYTVKVPERAKVIGKTIKDITGQKDFPDECVFMGVDNDEREEFSITRGNYVIQEGDIIFLISKSAYIKQATDVLTKR
jgi:trk system potassium uptake protein TrkA